MRINRIKICICILVMCTLCGCTEKTLEYPADSILTSFLQGQRSSEDTFVDDTFTSFMKRLPDDEKELINTALSLAKVTSKTDDGVLVSYSIQIPNIQKPLDEFLASEAYFLEYNKLKSVDENDESIKEYVLSTVNTIVSKGVTDWDSVCVTADMYSEMLDSSDPIVTLFKETFGVSGINIIPTYDNGNTFVLPSSDSSFVYLENDVKILISDISIKSGDEASTVLSSFSDVNQTNFSGELYYITFHATNLSEKESVVHSYFCSTDSNGAIYENDCEFVGLIDVSPIKSGETVSMSDVVVKPSNADISWYSENIKGGIRLNNEKEFNSYK